MAHNLCISVGVSEYTSGLTRLPGAAVAAGAFSVWASTAGYRSILISDANGKAVTAARIKHVLEVALRKSEINRFIFFFAGHGTAVAAANECWLLTNVLKDPDEAIDRLAFYRQLQTYRIPQIAFFADACRTVSSLSFNVNGRSILSHSGADRVNPQFDLFLAASLGHPALMVKGMSDSKDRCLFTEVLLDGLYGKAEAAIEKFHHPDAPAVVSHTLANFVETEAKNKASLLNRINEPEIQAAFRAPNDVYLKLHLDSQRADTGQPDRSPDCPYVPASDQAGQPVEERQQRRQRIDERIARDTLARITPRFLRTKGRREGGQYIPALRPGSWTYEFREQFDPFIFRGIFTGAIWSGAIAALAVPASMRFELRDRWSKSRYIPDGIAFNLGNTSSLMFTVARDGNWPPVPVFPRLVAVVTQSNSGVGAINYVGREQWEGDIYADYTDILAPLTSGKLRPGDAQRIADRIRTYKHNNPIFGVIAGYLYAATGDIDNINRTANYYYEMGQEVPFDLALLAASDLRWERAPDAGFRVFARFPSVPDANPQRLPSNRPYFALGDFPAREEVPVCGFMPWLRQGWSMLTSDTHLDVPEVLNYVGRRLRGGTFTTMSSQAGRRLARELNYEVFASDGSRERRRSR